MRYIKYLTDRMTGKAPRGAKRSPLWRAVRAKHLEQYPTCLGCGGTKKLEVHHIIPFHVAPDLELVPTNLMTLCRRKKFGIHCHLLLGHFGSYRRFNINAREHARTWRYRINPDGV